jgi:fructokinase
MTRLVKTVLSFGETLWDLLPSGRLLGGAPCNLAFRVNSLGERGLLVTRLGRDELGDAAAQQLRDLGLELDLVQADDRRPTGTVPVTLDAKGVPDFKILPDVAYDYIAPSATLLGEASRADCICFGTLVQRSPVSRTTLYRVLEAAPRALKVLDLNLRRGCYERGTVMASLEAADVLKLNGGEVLELARTFGLNGGSPQEAARACRATWDLDACVVTLGAQGVYGVTATEEAVVEGRKVDVVDTIGAGDAFTAAFVVGRLRGHSFQDCCYFGNALGALVSGTKGATSPIGLDEINRVCGRTI